MDANSRGQRSEAAWWIVLILIFAAAATRSRGADYWPTNRMPTPSGWRGVAGASFTNRPVSVTMTNLDNTGATDVSAAIQTAIGDCAEGTAIFFPAGVYALSNTVSLPYKSRVTIRGETGTRFDIRGGDGFQFGTVPSPYPELSISITSGATQGSSNVVASTNGALVAGLVKIGQEDVPGWVFADTVLGAVTTNNLSTIHQITAVGSNSITFVPPLIWTLTNTPRLAYLGYPVELIGLESLHFNSSNYSCMYAVSMNGTANYWITNCEVSGHMSRSFLLSTTTRGSLQRNYIHDQPAGVGANKEGLDLYRDCSFNLVENNLFVRGGGPPVCLGDFIGSVSGNVIAYNAFYATTSVGYPSSDISGSHAPGNILNLFEGNYCELGFTADGYYGGALLGTIFRNRFVSAQPAGTVLNKAIDLCRWNYDWTIAGNVLGTNDRVFQYEIYVDSYADEINSIYRLGYPMGYTDYDGVNPPDTNRLALDLNVTNSLVRLGNYDYATESVDQVVTLPASYYLTEKPAWFGTNAWPAIGGELDPMVSEIPAMTRYAALSGGGEPPAPGGSGEGVSVTGGITISGGVTIQ